MNKITIVFETPLSTNDLHELLCKAIHEEDTTCLATLNEKILDIEVKEI